MAIRTSSLGLIVIVTAALAGACAGGDGQSSQTGDLNGAGGSGAGAAPPFGSGGAFPGGAGAPAGGAPPFGSGGAPPFGSGGAQPFGSGGAQPFGSGGAQPFGGVPNGTGGEGPPGNGGSQGGTGPDPTSDSASKQGTCTVLSYTAGVPAAADYVNPTVYYPSAGCTGPFPGVVVIPGFTEQTSAINQWGTFLASHGFVVMTVDTAANGAANTGVLPASRALGLAEGVTTLKGEDTRSGSPVAGKVDTTRMAIMGHSMGGGGTLLAANTHPELKAAIGLCPWNPGVTYPTDTVPSLFFDGTADILVPPAAAIAEYDSIPTSTPKVYAEFNGGSHFVANTPLGLAATDKVVARIGLSWLEVYVVGDTRYQQFIVKDASMSTWKP